VRGGGDSEKKGRGCEGGGGGEDQVRGVGVRGAGESGVEEGVRTNGKGSRGGEG